MTVESLGTQTIEGLLVEGKRRTVRYSEGSAGAEFYSISEMWFSPELRVYVLVKSSNPRAGTTNTTRLTQIDRAEPDSSLFRPPAEYAIADQ
jgi:hypothetical protein